MIYPIDRNACPKMLCYLQKSLGDTYVVSVTHKTALHAYFFIEWVVFQDSDRFNPAWVRGNCRWARHENLTRMSEL